MNKSEKIMIGLWIMIGAVAVYALVVTSSRPPQIVEVGGCEYITYQSQFRHHAGCKTCFGVVPAHDQTEVVE